MSTDYNDSEEYDNDDIEASLEADMQAITHKLHAAVLARFEYLVAEGFLEKTDTPGEYVYTPEGIAVLMKHIENQN